MTADPPLLALRGLKVRLGGASADPEYIPDFSLVPGRCLIVTGPSGAGKSTLLRVLAGIDEPVEGEVALCGRRLMAGAGRDATEVRRRLAAMIQPSALVDGTVRYNAELGLRLRGKLGPAENERVRSLLAELALDQVAHRSAASLSSGEAQRVAIVRTMAIGARVLLLDEPASHLDRELTAAVQRLLRRHLDEGGAMVLALHEDELADGLPGHRLSLRDGRVAAWQPEEGGAGDVGTG